MMQAELAAAREQAAKAESERDELLSEMQLAAERKEARAKAAARAERAIAELLHSFPQIAEMMDASGLSEQYRTFVFVAGPGLKSLFGY